MEEPIHAHELLNFIFEKEECTKEDLREFVSKNFPKDAKFTNCTGNIYSFQEILDFFVEMGKVTISGNKISVNSDKICNH